MIKKFNKYLGYVPYYLKDKIRRDRKDIVYNILSDYNPDTIINNFITDINILNKPKLDF